MFFILNRFAPQSMYEKLCLQGHFVIPSANISSLPHPLATHPDLQIHILDEKTAVCAPECFSYYRAYLPKSIYLVKGESELTGTYPGDCAYNVARTGRVVFCNTKYTDPLILKFYRDRGVQIIHVNQGYTRCNICPVTNELILTEDEGIHNTIMGNKGSVTSILLPKGEVELTGYPYGFIGGSCGHDGKTIYWYGNPKCTSFYDEIYELLQKYRLNSISLGEGSLCDFGSIICFPSRHIIVKGSGKGEFIGNGDDLFKD